MPTPSLRRQSAKERVERFFSTDSPFNFNKRRCSISKTTGVDHSLLERSKALFAQLTSATDTPSSASDSILSPETQSSDSSQPSSELLSLSETDPNPSPSSAPTEQSTSQTATNSNSSKGRPTKTVMEASPKTRIRKLMDLELPECCILKFQRCCILLYQDTIRRACAAADQCN